ncbi:DsbA family oxidoreductase [Pseudomonas sp. MDT1-16]
MKPLKVEYFHDVVCGWCFVLGPRLKALSEEFDLDIQHRSFVLQSNNAQMIQRFGSMPQAKEVILQHWEQCANAEEVKRINIEDMRQQDFEYPSGLLAAKACQTAQSLAGPKAHELMFDRLQHAHLVESRNIGSLQTILEVAEEQGFTAEYFAQYLHQHALSDLENDLARGLALNISSVPSLVVEGMWMIPGALSLDMLCDNFTQMQQAIADNLPVLEDN